MARIRTIKPEIWEDEKVGLLDPLAALTFVGLISLADDQGRGRADPVFLKSRLHPYRTTTVRLLSESLTLIGERGLAVFYEADGQSYYFIPKFSSHQVINKPKPSRFPAPTVLLPEQDGIGTVSVPDEDGTRNVLARAEGNGREGNGTGKGMERNGAEAEWSGMDQEGAAASVETPAAPDTKTKTERLRAIRLAEIDKLNRP